MPRALLSVSDKTGIVDLGRGLARRGFTLISTGGTARELSAAGLAVRSVSDLTGVPEMMDGRVKTLHPAVHGGILARRDRPDDLAAIASQGIDPIDVVVVNLYPFAETAKRPGVTFDDLVEQIDIGGPSLVRAAAKNFRDVLVVVDPSDYPRLLAAVDEGPTPGFRFDLMRRAFAHTAEYDGAIARALADVEVRGDRFERPVSPSTPRPADLHLSLSKIRDLRYGENPHQRAAWYRESYVGSGFPPSLRFGEARLPPSFAEISGELRRDLAEAFAEAGSAERGGGSQTLTGFGDATLLQGKELSYTNLLDLDAAARIVLEFDVPAAAVIKHTNPCGVAIGVTTAEAYVRARDADSLSAFGGIVALNRAIDVETARAITATKIDAAIAPAVDEEAREILARKTNMRVVTADCSDARAGGLELRSILGAILAQERDLVVEARASWTPEALPEGFRVVSRRPPTGEEWEALRFAWRVCAHVKSNSVVFASKERTLAIGAGQMSRVDAVRVAVMTARGSTEGLAGSVAATDGFLPFRDGADALATAGATAVIHPGGSVRDEEVIASADEHDVAMVFTGRRHFRH
jgi:phosphoribosylaminoimidazolecarboxamide formyltransferase/IMP cyclohydrolase